MPLLPSDGGTNEKLFVALLKSTNLHGVMQPLKRFHQRTDLRGEKLMDTVSIFALRGWTGAKQLASSHTLCVHVCVCVCVGVCKREMLSFIHVHTADTFSQVHILLRFVGVWKGGGPE